MSTVQQTSPATGLETTKTSGSDAIVTSLISPVEIIRIAWEGVVRNKVRSLLTMLGVIITAATPIITPSMVRKQPSLNRLKD